MSAMECTHNGCTEGEGGAKFKTPALAPQHALESSDGEIFHVDVDIAKQSVTTKTMLDEEVVPLPDITVATVKSQNVPVFAVPAWTSPTSSLAEIPRPVLTTGCSEDSFMYFKRRWKSYVKYYERDGGGKKEDGEIKIQLLSSLDTALQLCLL